MDRSQTSTAVVLLSLLLTGFLFGQSSEQLEFFEKKIRPILATKCYSCHGSKVQIAGLNLSSAAGFGSVVVKGDPGSSRLFRAVSYSEKIKMPPTGKLADQEIEDLKSWIDAGAPWPEDEQVSAARSNSVPSEHWAFQAVRGSEPPKVTDAAWVKSPVDRFILAKLEEKGIRPAARASALTLLRRVTYDLTGLPPTPKEIDEFLADGSNGAFAKVVDRLLASPQYGEHWGRHWLDVARFADSTGLDEDHVYPQAWRYRDYVVNAFNDDLPYDRFVIEQIAGDLLAAEKPNALNTRCLIATGFLALGPKPLAQQDRVKAIYDVVDEQIDTTSKAFLGLTIACARCHDHKFDPILTKDYYSLASIFASTTTYRNLGRSGFVSYLYFPPLDPGAHERYQAHRWRMYGKQLEMEEALAEDLARENALLRPRLADFLIAAWKVERNTMKPEAAAAAHGLEARQVERWLRWLRSVDEKARQGYLKNWVDATEATIDQVAREYQERYLKAATKLDEQLENWRRRFANEGLQDRNLPGRPKPGAETDPFFAAVTFDGGPMELADSPRVAFLRKEWKELEASLPSEPPTAAGVREGPIVDQKVFIRGDHQNPGEPVAKQFPIVLAGESQPRISKGSGRLELGQWLTSPDQPLTARVMVNRIWQWHFGEGLVRTPNNWGKTGEKPTHPELLDFLARRFVESGWSVKAMHRMILLSSTYQMSTRTTKAVHDRDPANRLWSHFNRVRMSVEQIRDSFLALSGTLDSTIGGSLMPAGSPTTGRRPRLDPDDVLRRTMYLPVRRGSIPTVLATFDYPDATTASDGRSRTNVPPQALFMMNSRFVVEKSLGFAKRLLGDSSLSDAQRVELAYRMALTRRPDGAEVDAALTYIGDLERKLGKSDAHVTAWQSFCKVLLSTNEFLYLN
jgi:hypothetical protein